MQMVDVEFARMRGIADDRTLSSCDTRGLRLALTMSCLVLGLRHDLGLAAGFISE